MGRIMAIDYGSKRVGLAVTDPLKIIASPLETVATNDIFAYLKKYLASQEVERFVVGLPMNLQNEDTHATGKTRKFIKGLKMVFPDIPLTEADERFTSKMAMDAMISGGASKKQRQEKGNIDKLSATLILQEYLEESSAL